MSQEPEILTPQSIREVVNRQGILLEIVGKVILGNDCFQELMTAKDLSSERVAEIINKYHNDASLEKN